jgi:sec-independent protein translocase protein TatB
MLPDLSGSHILIVLIAALIFIGPKDLPKFLHRIGKFVGKMRGMANEFRASFDEMARQSELDDLRKEVEAMRKASQAALPQELGIEAQMKSDAEAAYLANWEASHATPTDTAAMAPEPTILPPPAPAPAPAPAAEPAPKKPRVSRAKPPAADGEAPPKPPSKPRAPRKPKPEAEA